MDKNDVCKFCDSLSPKTKCEHKKECPLQKLNRENEKLFNAYVNERIKYI